MPYILAVDGGATKTHGLIGDESGNILAEIKTGPSNHQIVGAEASGKVFQETFDRLLRAAGIRMNDIALCYLGLSGADLPSDFTLYEKILRPILGNVPFKVVNDCWIALASGSEEGWGAVCICGTGSNAAARNREGQEVILRSLSYALGNFGGGGDLAEEAVHYAFRSEEGTGKKSALEVEIPRLAGVADLAELAHLIYHGEKTLEDIPGLPALVFSLADQGDTVSQEILINMGEALGAMTAGVIKRTAMEDLAVPVVLSGSVFNGSSPLLIDSLNLALHRVAPKAFLRRPDHPPVIGAYREAIRWLQLSF